MRILFVGILLLSFFSLFSQNAQICNESEAFCSDSDYEFPLGTGTSAELGPNYGCLYSQPNPVWYFLRIDHMGDIIISIVSSSRNDIDFICWGPFTSPQNACSNQLTQANIVDCSYSANSWEQCDIFNAQEGEYYILLVTNYSDRQGNLEITTTNAGNFGSGSTDCSIVNDCSFTEIESHIICEDDGTYTVEGAASFYGNPNSGIMKIRTNTGSSLIFEAPFSSPTSFALPPTSDISSLTEITFGFSDSTACREVYDISQVTSSYSTAPGNLTICQVDSLQMRVNGNGNYTWYTQELGGAEVATSTMNNPTNLVALSDITDITGTEPERTFTLFAEDSEMYEMDYTFRNNINTSLYEDVWGGDDPRIGLRFEVMQDIVLNELSVQYLCNSTSDGVIQINIYNSNDSLVGGYTQPVGCSGNYEVIDMAGLDIHLSPGNYYINANGSTVQFRWANDDVNYPEEYSINGTDILNVEGPLFGVMQPNSSPAFYNWGIVTELGANQCGRTPVAVTETCLDCVPPQSVDFASRTADTAYCQGEFATFTASAMLNTPSFGYYYSVFLPDGSSIYNGVNPPSYNQLRIYAENGTYIYRVEDGNNGDETCYLEDSVQILVTEAFDIDLGQDTTICEGEVVRLTSGISDASYLWSTGETTDTISVTSLGDYAVTVTQGGCSSSNSIRVHTEEYPRITMSDSVLVCESSYIVVRSGYDEYLWSTGETTPGIFVDEIDTYHVTVVNNGCETYDSVYVDISEPVEVNLGSDTTICSNDSILLDAGDAEAYIWSTGDTTRTIYTESNAFYLVTVTRGMCVDYDMRRISYIDAPEIDFADSIIACESAIIDAGVYESFIWNTGAETQSIMVFTSGQYTVTATGNGCETTDSVEVEISSNFVVNLGNDTTICENSGFLLDAGEGDTYIWSTGETSRTISPEVSGMYNVRVTRGACSDVDIINITIIPTPDVELGNDTAACDLALIDAGAEMDAYAWSNGEFGQILSVAETGNYTVTVTKDGCDNSDSLYVAIFNSFEVSLRNDTVICADEEIIFSAGEGDSYIWNTGAETESITINTSGIYSVTVTQGACFDVDSIQLTVTPLPVIELGEDIAACDLTVLDAGDGMDAYTWSNGSSDQTLSVTESGDYSVIVTKDGCDNTDDISVAISNSFEVSLRNDTVICADEEIIFSAGEGDSYIWNTGAETESITTNTSGIYSVTVTQGACSDVDSIQLTVTPLPVIELGEDIAACDVTVLDAGAGMDAYVWSNGSSDQTLSVTESGDYSVIVTKDGCDNTDDIIVEISYSFEVALGNDTVICADEEIEFNAGEGDSYIWNTEAATQSITTNTSGIYSVTVTQGACSDVDSIQLTVTPLPVIELGEDLEACDVTVLDAGAGMDAYAWSNGSSDQTLSVTESGDYSVIVTKDGCNNTDDIIVEISYSFEVALGNDTVICADEEIEFNAGEGDSYIWNTEAATQSITTNTSGIYSVTVTRGACSDVDSIQLTVTPLPVIELGEDLAACDVTVLDAGAGMDAYAWSNGSSDQTLSVTESGDYSVIVTKDGCNNTDDIIVEISYSFEVALGNDTVICADEEIEFNAGEGDSYIWNTEAATQSITTNTSGMYSVTVTRGACSDVDSIQLTVTPLPVIELGEDLAACDVTVLDAGAGMDAYAWSNGSSDQTLSVTESGDYSVIVTKDGCDNTDDISVEISYNFEVALGNDTVICADEEIEFNAGEGDSFIWNTSATTQQIDINTSGIYSVTVTRGACSDVDSIILDVLPMLSPQVSIATTTADTCAGAEISFSIADSENLGNSPVYAWNINSQLVSSSSSFMSNEILDADIVSLSVTSSERCTIEPVAEDQVEINIDPILDPEVELISSENIVCEGFDISFTTILGNEGIVPHFIWTMNGNNIDASESSTQVEYTESGYMKVSMYSSERCVSNAVVADSVYIDVLEYMTPSVAIAPIQDSVCDGEQVSFIIADSSALGTSPVYQWMINDVNFATTPEFGTNNINDEDVVSLEVTSSYMCLTANTAQDENIVTITPLANPTITLVAEDESICAAQQTHLSVENVSYAGEYPQYLWYINDELAETNSTGTFISGRLVNDNSEVKVVLESSYACLASNNVADSVIIEVNPLVHSNLTISSHTLCENSLIDATVIDTLNGGANPQFIWYINNVAVDTAFVYYTNSVVAGDIIKAKMISSIECPENREVFDSLEVLPSPQMSISYQQDLCAMSSPIDIEIFNSNGFGGYAHHFPALGLFPYNDNYRFSPFTAQEGVHELTFGWTDENQCQSEQTITIDVHDVPEPQVPTLYTDIIGYPPYQIFRAEAQGQVNWYDANQDLITSGSETYTPGVFCNSSECIYTYYVSQTDEQYGCESDLVRITYTMTTCRVPAPTTDDAFICEGSEIPSLHADTAQHWVVSSPIGESELKWYTTPYDTLTGIINEGTEYTPDEEVSGAGRYEFYVRQYNPGVGCHSPAVPVMLEIWRTGEPEIIDRHLEICEGGYPLTFLSLGQNVVWYSSESNEIVGEGITYTDSVSEPGEYHYYTTQSQQGCESDTVHVTYRVHPEATLPRVSFRSGCEGDDHWLRAISPADSIFWYDARGEQLNDNDGIGWLLDIDESWLNAGDATVFKAVAMTHRGCKGDTTSSSYELIATPALPEVIEAPHVYCENDLPLPIQVAESADSIVWFIDTIRIQRGFEMYPLIDGLDSVRFDMVAYNQYCPGDTASVAIAVVENPTPAITGSDRVCITSFNTPYIISNLNQGSEYEWIAPGNVSFNTNEIELNWYNSGTDTLKLIETNEYGCKSTAVKLIAISEVPEADFAWHIPYPLRSAIFRNTTYQNPIEIEGSRIVPELVSKWDFGIEDDTIALKSYNQIDTINFDYGTYLVTMEVSNNFGCTSTVTKEIEIKEEVGIYVPNAFSPTNESEGVREFIPAAMNLKTYELKIYDKWDNLVFFSDKLTPNGEPAEGWNGTYAGKYLKNDSYIWQIRATFLDGYSWRGYEYTDGEYYRQGVVVLIK